MISPINVSVCLAHEYEKLWCPTIRKCVAKLLLISLLSKLVGYRIYKVKD